MNWGELRAFIVQGRYDLDRAEKDLNMAEDLEITPLHITHRPHGGIAIHVASFEDFEKMRATIPECTTIADIPFLSASCENCTELLWSSFIGRNMGRVQNED